MEDKNNFTKEIKNSFWMNISDFNISVIFDKDFFEEDEPKRRETERTVSNDKWKFNADDPNVICVYEKIKHTIPEIKIGDDLLKNFKRKIDFDENGKPRPHQEYGFVFFPRVPKRTFKGLVVKVPKDELYNQRIQEVADVVVESKLEIPIYDIDGNVLWPKKMSFEEVKRSIRDKYKEKDE